MKTMSKLSNFTWIFWGAILFLKVFAFGFGYRPLMDDHILFGTYHLYEPYWMSMFTRNVASRPIAVLLDVFVWTNLFEHLWVMLILITLLYLLSGYLFVKAFEKIGKPVGQIFLFIYFMAPFGLEATYWLSAATRIVVGLAFTAFTIYLIESHRPIWQWCMVQIISYGFYEQVALLSLALSIYFLYIREKQHPQYLFKELTLHKKTIWKRTRLWGLPFVNLLPLIIYYMVANPLSPFGKRGELTVSLIKMQEVLQEIIRFWTEIQANLFVNGVQTGFSLWLEKPFYFLVTGFMAVWLFELFRRENEQLKVDGAGLWGAVFFILPLSLFFVLSSGSMSFRVFFPSLIGLGILVEGLYRLTLVKKVLPLFFSLLFILLMGVNLSEMQAYYATALRDEKAIAQLAPLVSLNAAIVNVNTHEELVEVRYAQHIQSVLSCDWALSGALRAKTKDAKLFVYPARTGEEVSPKAKSYVGIDEKLGPVKLIKKENRLLKGDTGEVFGTVDDGVFYTERSINNVSETK